MKLYDFAMVDPAGFATFCTTLRNAGVTELGAMKLGPLPRDASTVEREVDPDAEAKRKHRIMFAAVRNVPPFVPQARETDTPRAIVQRRARDEAAADGKTIAKR